MNNTKVYFEEKKNKQKGNPFEAKSNTKDYFTSGNSGINKQGGGSILPKKVETSTEASNKHETPGTITYKKSEKQSRNNKIIVVISVIYIIAYIIYYFFYI